LAPAGEFSPLLENTMKYWIAALGFLVCTAATAAGGKNDIGAIEDLLVSAYVEGIYVNRDEQAVRKGFHPDFVMHVLDNGQLIQAPLDMWLGRLALDGNKSTTPYDYTFESTVVTGNAAVVSMKIFEDSRHIYTDYFGLYKFDDGWKIVNKIFYGHN
jgi:hypothetical protein